MPQKTEIEWTRSYRPDGTWEPGYSSNPIRARNLETKEEGWFCIHASPGCKNCYAETLNRRFGTKQSYTAQNAKKVKFYLVQKELEGLQALNRRLAKEGKTAKVFVGDMLDIWLPDIPHWLLYDCFDVFTECTNLTFLLLTKRAKEMRQFVKTWCETAFLRKMPAHLWFGVSAEDQDWADARVPDLLMAKVSTRFVSYEPALGPVNWKEIGKHLSQDGQDECGIDALLGVQWSVNMAGGGAADTECNRIDWIDWIIAGGESGPKARPPHPDWFRSTRDQCQSEDFALLGIPKTAFFFKQMGEYATICPETPMPLDQVKRLRAVAPDGSISEHFGEGVSAMWRAGKKKAGRILDGRTWDEMPEVKHG